MGGHSSALEEPAHPDERPEPRTAEDLPPSRRGDSTVRQRTMSAYESLCFPPFPDHAVYDSDFEIPRAVLDRDAPLSAHKWDLALTLAMSASTANAARREELMKLSAQVQQAAEEPLPEPEVSKRTRRPTAIMRHNTEVARLMALPGTKQKVQVANGAGTHDRPQHTSASKQRERERIKRERAEQASSASDASGPSPGANMATHEANQGVAPLRCSSSEEAAPQQPRPAPAPAPASASAPAPAPAASLLKGPTLPYATSIPAELLDPRVVITDVVVRSVLAPGQASGAVRRVRGIVLNKHRDQSVDQPAAAALTPSSRKDKPSSDGGKRKRRPPSWMSATEWNDENGADETPPERAFSRRRPAPLATIAAVLDDGRSRVLSSALPATICVYGIVPPAVTGERERERVVHERAHAPRRERSSGSSNHSNMPPPLHVPSERSPRLTGQGSRSPRDRPGAGGGPSPRLRPKEDGFAVYLGDLPSPRMIEVVKAKEVLLPGWRTTAAPPRPAAGLAGGGGPVPRATPGEESSSDDDEETTDEVFERRHARTLERAIMAARAVARDMALKDRERKQAAAHHHTSDSLAKPDNKAGEDEWKFRPSELAALCAAASMSWGADGATSAEGAAPSSAGFFGLGGANRGADNEKKSGATEAGSGQTPAAEGDRVEVPAAAGSAGGEQRGEENASEMGADDEDGVYDESEDDGEETADEPLVGSSEADALIDSILSPEEEDVSGFSFGEASALQHVMGGDAMALDRAPSPLLSPAIGTDEGHGSRRASSPIDHDIDDPMDDEGIDEMYGEDGVCSVRESPGRASSPTVLPSPELLSDIPRDAEELGGSLLGDIEMESGEGSADDDMEAHAE